MTLRTAGRRAAVALAVAALAAVVAWPDARAATAAQTTTAKTTTAKTATAKAKAKPKPKAASKREAIARVVVDPGPEPAEKVWARARALSDDERHDDALQVVRKGLSDHPDDTDLLWLEAGATGWSGRHRESVSLFERLLARHPEMARDVRLDLATERLWAGDPGGALRDLDMRLQEQPADVEARRLRALALAHADRLPQSLDAYDELLAGGDQDPDVTLGRAQVLAWMGRHDQAREAYEGVLARHPDDPQARLGLAMNENWDGRHRAAAARYEDILRGPEPDPEAYKGLAWAHYWGGRPDRAHAPLERYTAARPDDPEGQELAVLLAREHHPGVTAGYDWSEDSDHLRIFTTTIEYRIAAGPRDGVSFHWRRDHVKDTDGRREPYRLGLAHERIGSDLWSSRAAFDVFNPGAGRPPHGMGGVALAWRPADRVRAEFDYVKEPVLTRLSLERDISERSGGVSVEWQAVSRLVLEADHHVLGWSDHNRGQRTSGGARFTIAQRRHTEVMATFGVDVLRTRFDLDNGYYDPERYLEYGPGLDVRWRPRAEWDLGLEARLGWQQERGAETEPFHNLHADAEFPIGRCTLHTELETSNSSLTSSSGFEQNRWLLYFAAPF